jgi:hypothetical protein
MSSARGSAKTLSNIAQQGIEVVFASHLGQVDQNGLLGVFVAECRVHASKNAISRFRILRGDLWMLARTHFGSSPPTSMMWLGGSFVALAMNSG